MQRWIMPVVIVKRDGARAVTDVCVVGTCFAIALGIVVTAKHLLTDDFGDPVDATGREDRSVGVLFVTDEPIPGQEEPYWGGLIDVRQIASSPDHDLALMQLQVPSTEDGRFPRFATGRLSIDAPELDSRVAVPGYSDSKSVFTPPNTINVEHKLRASTGVVQELHIPRRDFMVYFPALSADFPSPGGMSGSPVFRTDGAICAMMSASLAPSLDDTVWTTSAALLPPLFAMELDTPFGDLPGRHSVYELAERGLVGTDGSHRKVEILKREDGLTDIRWRL